MFGSKTRKSRGQAMVTLGLFIGVMVLLVLGMYTYEVNRLTLARAQLRSASDAAALSAAASLASSNVTDTTTAQNTAIQTALNTFQQNSILGIPLTSASLVYSASENPGANQASMFVQFLDPNNNFQPVALGDANGKIVQITSSFGVMPSFANFLGLNSVPVMSISSGGVPQLDLVLCFDVSASIDDQTPVTFVKRYWNKAAGVTNYTIASTTSGSPAGSLAEGTIFNIVGPPAVGTACDATYPQNLSSADIGMSYPMYFSEYGGTTGSATGLRGSPNAGSPPGNYSNSSMSLGKAQTFTDLVVNIDGNTIFGGITANGFAFPNLATLVEAARGNLENNTVFVNSKANVSVPASVTPKVGYQAEYFTMAKQNLHPLYDAQVAAQDFLTIMNNNTNAHFSLVCFTTNAGTSPTTSYSMDNIDSSYGAGGTGTFVCPTIALVPTTGTSNYTTCYNTLPTTMPISGTNIGDAVNTAVTQLNTNARAGSKKAIVLFTDGEPTDSGPLSSDDFQNARDAASKAATAGIPVYCIGLAQNSAIIPSETAILTDTNSSPTAGGIAGIAGNGGKFFLVTNVQNLQLTFENIARNLVQLVTP